MFGDRMLRQETLKPKSVGATLSRFSRYFRPYWWALILVTGLMAVNAYSQVIGPQLIGQAVDCFLAPAVVSEAGRADGADGSVTATVQRGAGYTVGTPASATVG